MDIDALFIPYLTIITPAGPRTVRWLNPRLRVTPYHVALLEAIARLPEELITVIIREALLVNGCAIANLDHSFSRHHVPGPQSRLVRNMDLQRVDVYTKGVGGQRGTHHTLQHQISYPAKLFPRYERPYWFDNTNPGLMAMRAFWPGSFDQAWIEARQEGLHTFSVFDVFFTFPGATFLKLATTSMPDILRRTNTIARPRTRICLPFTRPMRIEDEISVQERMIPHLDGSMATYFADIRHLSLATTIRGRSEGLRLEPELEEQEDDEDEWRSEASEYEREMWDRQASMDRMLWLWLDWSALSKLETLVMDLSALHDLKCRFTDDGHLDEEIWKAMNVDMDHFEKTRQVRIRGMDCLNLSLLVIKGLRSGRHSYIDTLLNGPFNPKVEDIEETFVLKHGEDIVINWVEVFRPCLAEGGRLVLMDNRDMAGSWKWPRPSSFPSEFRNSPV